MSFKTVEWSQDLDLSNFYKEAEKRGFINNASQKMLIDCFNNEREKQAWILYYNDKPVGSVVAHSFDDVMGPNSYRIAARTCVFTNMLEGLTYGQGLRGSSVITQFQNPTAQFLIPICISWAPKDADLYITSNQNEVGTQKRVHNIFGPLMQKQGIMQPIKNVIYRHTEQTVWKFNQVEFLKQLNTCQRWK